VKYLKDAGQTELEVAAMTMLMLLCTIVQPAQDSSAGKVLIVHDEPAPMEVLAGALREKAGLTVLSVEQDKLPDDLSGYRAVFNFVHRPMTTRAERLCIEYARNGGRHILLDHAISSSKRENPTLLDKQATRLATLPIQLTNKS
jgi:hypothetical protein